MTKLFNTALFASLASTVAFAPDFGIGAGLYDFKDTAGVPDEVAADVNKERRSGLDNDLYDAVVAVVTGAPKALTIKQVIFVLHKLVSAEKLDKVPTENTVRSYLNRARENGDIGKPSRQSYWTVESDAGEAAEDAPAAEGIEGGEKVANDASQVTEGAEGAASFAGEGAENPEASDEYDPLAD